jgi:hypothetical protein
MLEHPNFNILVITYIFLLPAIALLLFAWFFWIGNKRPIMEAWRHQVFRYGLFSAALTTILFAVSGLHLLRTLEPAQGVWLLINWFGLFIWLSALAASLSGKGWARVLLFSWGILLFVGVFGITTAEIP